MSIENARSMLRELGLETDYAAMDLADLGVDIHGWASEDPIFTAVIDDIRPRFIIEVGTWKGASAIHMAGLLADRGLDALVLCIDTWLGSNESLWRDPEQRRSLQLKDGFPTMYRQFCRNVVHAGHEGRIRHLPMTSTSAAELLTIYGVQADAVYIDAGHQEAEVYQDILAFWPLVRPGGVLFGDDYMVEWPGCVRAVNRFAAETGLKLIGTRYKWRIDRPAG